MYLSPTAASKAASRDDSRKPGGFPLSASRRASADGPQWLNGRNLSPYERVSFTPAGCADEDYFHSGRPADSGGPCTVINTCIEARHIPPSPSFLTPFQQSQACLSMFLGSHDQDWSHFSGNGSFVPKFTGRTHGPSTRKETPEDRPRVNVPGLLSRWNPQEYVHAEPCPFPAGGCPCLVAEDLAHLPQICGRRTKGNNCVTRFRCRRSS